MARLTVIFIALFVASVDAATEVEPENNDWQTATRLAANVPFTGTQTNDDDWYEIEVPAGSLRVLIELAFIHADGNMTMTLWDDDGAGPTSPVPATTTTDNEFIDKDYSLTVDPGTKYINVLGESGAGGNAGNSYTLTWTSLPSGADDGYEDNDDSANAAATTEATTLFGIQSDQDWYRINVGPDSSSLEIRLTFRHDGTSNASNIDMELRDTDGNLVESAATTTDNETIVKAGLAEGAYNLKVFGPNSGSGYALIWQDESSVPADSAPPDPEAQDPVPTDDTTTTTTTPAGDSDGAMSLPFVVLLLLTMLALSWRSHKTGRRKSTGDIEYR